MSYTPLFANLQPQIPARGVCSRRQFVGGVMGIAATLAAAGPAQAAGTSGEIIVPSPAALVPMTSQLSDAKGQAFDLASLAGQPVLINFWATWCAPCKKEMPSLDLLQLNKNLKNLKIFPINVGQDNIEKASKFFDDLEIKNLELYFDSEITLAKKFGLRGIPTTILLDKEGREFARILGSIDFNDEKFINWLSLYN